MKVEVTVTAEFPFDTPAGIIEKLAREHTDAAVVKNATVTHIEETTSDGAARRRLIEWKTDCIDLRDTIFCDRFQSWLKAAAGRGLKLERRIRKLCPDGRPGEELENTVARAWTVID